MREREVVGVENRQGLETSVVRVSNPCLWFMMGEWFLFVSLTHLNTLSIFPNYLRRLRFLPRLYRQYTKSPRRIQTDGGST